MKEIFQLNSNVCSHDMEEYKRINEEMLKRMNWLFSHGYTLVSMVAVFWSITLSVLGTVLTSTVKLAYPFDFCIPSLVVLLVGLPGIIVLPFSVKYQDSLRTVSNIATYLRVFYELPSMMKKAPYAKKEIKDQAHHTVLAWETLHCDTHFERTRGFGIEYAVVAIAALVLSLATGITTMLFYARYQLLFGIIFPIYWLVLLYMVIKVCGNSNSKSTLKYYFNRCIHRYLAKAVVLGMFTHQECEIYLNYIGGEIMQEKLPGNVKKYDFRSLNIIALVERLLPNENYKEIEKMYIGQPFNKDDNVYRKLLELSKKYCTEYTRLCSIPEKDLTEKQKARKEELLDTLFPGHGTLYGVGTGIEVVIGMVELGDNCYINANVKFNPNVKVKTGDYFICAPNVTFGSDEIFNKVKKIEIGDDVWVCADVQVQKEAKIGSRSVIGLGSAVKTRSVLGEDGIYSGNPVMAVSAIENRGAATCKSEHTEPFDDYEKAFVAHLQGLGFDGDFSQLLYLLRGEKYNAQDPLVASVTGYTHALCAEYQIADENRKAELKNILFPFKGDICSIGNNVFLECIGSVRLGNHVTIGDDVTLMGKVMIGDGCKIENEVSLIAIGHEVYHENRHVLNGCMITTSGYVEIRPGVTVGKGCKIGPKDIIEANVEAYTARNNGRTFQLK